MGPGASGLAQRKGRHSDFDGAASSRAQRSIAKVRLRWRRRSRRAGVGRRWHRRQGVLNDGGETGDHGNCGQSGLESLFHCKLHWVQMPHTANNTSGRKRAFDAHQTVNDLPKGSGRPRGSPFGVPRGAKVAGKPRQCLSSSTPNRRNHGWLARHFAYVSRVRSNRSVVRQYIDGEPSRPIGAKPLICMRSPTRWSAT